MENTFKNPSVIRTLLKAFFFHFIKHHGHQNCGHKCTMTLPQYTLPYLHWPAHIHPHLPLIIISGRCLTNCLHSSVATVANRFDAITQYSFLALLFCTFDSRRNGIKSFNWMRRLTRGAQSKKHIYTRAETFSTCQVAGAGSSDGILLCLAN